MHYALCQYGVILSIIVLVFRISEHSSYSVCKIYNIIVLIKYLPMLNVPIIIVFIPQKCCSKYTTNFEQHFCGMKTMIILVVRVHFVYQTFMKFKFELNIYINVMLTKLF